MSHLSTRSLLPILATLLPVMLGLIPSPAISSDETPAEQEKAPEDLKNTIKWQTSSEVDNFGFDVFRADSAEGPWQQINPETIEGQGTTDEITSYAFEDRTIDPCRSYFYYVESISMSGDREHFTPVGQAKAKLPADDPQCAGAAEKPESRQDHKASEDPEAGPDSSGP